ncbi:MAG: hypothetical protein H0T15_04250 [Thermoleophilaceae bacterium]|nr:hypothetical protein [Thermoleophilaceae bacterium]
MSDAPFAPGALLESLVRGGVDFVVIGGVAVYMHGYERATKDLDITYAKDPANLEALGAVLVELDAELKGAPAGLPFVPDARALRQVEILTLRTSRGDLDLLASPSGAPSYSTLKRRAVLQDAPGVAYRVCSFEDLMSMKRAAGRLRDLADIEELGGQ